jgi:hypothetical protein
LHHDKKKVDDEDRQLMSTPCKSTNPFEIDLYTNALIQPIKEINNNDLTNKFFMTQYIDNKKSTILSNNSIFPKMQQKIVDGDNIKRIKSIAFCEDDDFQRNLAFGNSSINSESVRDISSSHSIVRPISSSS